eukprot:4485497-Ditylum_brightwellii.AAC.1
MQTPCKHDDIIIIVLESGRNFVPHLVEKSEYVKKPARATISLSPRMESPDTRYDLPFTSDGVSGYK